MSSMEIIQKATPVEPPPEFFTEVAEKDQEQVSSIRANIATSLAKTLKAATNSKDWMSEGACYGDREAAGLLTDGDTLAQRQGIEKYCSSCPVKEDCLTHALKQDEQQGVWGGMTPKQRARLRGAISRRSQK